MAYMVPALLTRMSRLGILLATEAIEDVSKTSRECVSIPRAERADIVEVAGGGVDVEAGIVEGDCQRGAETTI